MTQVINTPRPGRSAIHDQIGTATDIEELKGVLRNLVNTVKFHEDDADASGQESLMLSSDAPIDGGVVVRNRTPVIPKTGNAWPPNTAPLGPVMGGMINHTLDGNLIPPDDPPGTGPAQPQMIPILRGFPNYAFDATQGGTLDAPAYGNQIPQQEVLFQMKIGNKIKYGRVPLLDNPDEATPRPLIGPARGITDIPAWSASVTYSPADRVISGGTAYVCILGNTNQVPPNPTYWTVLSATSIASEGIQTMNAIVQMHNDLVQSLITMGVFRMVPRDNDKIDFDNEGPG